MLTSHLPRLLESVEDGLLHAAIGAHSGQRHVSLLTRLDLHTTAAHTVTVSFTRVACVMASAGAHVC